MTTLYTLIRTYNTSSGSKTGQKFGVHLTEEGMKPHHIEFIVGRFWLLARQTRI